MHTRYHYKLEVVVVFTRALLLQLDLWHSPASFVWFLILHSIDIRIFEYEELHKERDWTWSRRPDILRHWSHKSMTSCWDFTSSIFFFKENMYIFWCRRFHHGYHPRHNLFQSLLNPPNAQLMLFLHINIIIIIIARLRLKLFNNICPKWFNIYITLSFRYPSMILYVLVFVLCIFFVFHQVVRFIFWLIVLRWLSFLDGTPCV